MLIFYLTLLLISFIHTANIIKARLGAGNGKTNDLIRHKLQSRKTKPVHGNNCRVNNFIHKAP